MIDDELNAPESIWEHCPDCRAERFADREEENREAGTLTYHFKCRCGVKWQHAIHVKYGPTQEKK